MTSRRSHRFASTLGGASDAVIQQFERWWEKYGVSLAQIDAEVKEAEAVMHGFLKELGYE